MEKIVEIITNNHYISVIPEIDNVYNSFFNFFLMIMRIIIVRKNLRVIISVYKFLNHISLQDISNFDRIHNW